MSSEAESSLEAEGSVTLWINDLKAGNPEALEPLWRRYFERLVLLARQRLQASRRCPSCADEEDAALSALNSLWDRASGGQLPDLTGRDELWRLLVVITARKAIRLVEREHRRKRGGGRLVNEAALVLAGAGKGDGDHEGLAGVIGREPTPEFAALVAEESRRRLDALGDETLRQVALWRMEGYSNNEIAARLGCVVRTVERKLEVIRKLWQRELGE
jgi:DNA-directed RNA polymerase specialized sigma24 family protein